jgi:hypothetical protein
MNAESILKIKNPCNLFPNDEIGITKKYKELVGKSGTSVLSVPVYLDST